MRLIYGRLLITGILLAVMIASVRAAPVDAGRGDDAPAASAKP